MKFEKNSWFGVFFYIQALANFTLSSPVHTGIDTTSAVDLKDQDTFILYFYLNASMGFFFR